MCSFFLIKTFHSSLHKCCKIAKLFNVSQKFCKIWQIGTNVQKHFSHIHKFMHTCFQDFEADFEGSWSAEGRMACKTQKVAKQWKENNLFKYINTYTFI